MSRFENFMFRGVPVWLVGVLAILAILGMVAFGNIAVHTSKGGTKAGPIGEAVLAIANIPEVVKDVRNAMYYLRIGHQRFEGRSGFDFSYETGSRPDAGYLLLSYYDIERRRGVVDLWDLNAQERLHTWLPPIGKINRQATGFQSEEIVLARDRSVSRMVLRHPVVMANGDLVIKSRSPLTRVDACNQIVWINDESLYHHATEMAGDGTFWVSTRIEPTTMRHVRTKTFLDDAVTQVSGDGEILFQRSLALAMLENGLHRYVYGRHHYMDNPLHLNDIQPVEADGPFWKKGDLFLSLRNHSLVMQYRPSEDRIVWYKEGPWLHQHDVDIIDDHRISIFDNNSHAGFPDNFIDGQSGVMIYDFETDTVSSPWAEAFERFDMRTNTEGLHKIRDNGEIMVEEQNSGRIIALDRDHELLWEYINRGENGHLYRLGWSRLLEPGFGSEVAQAVAEKSCL